MKTRLAIAFALVIATAVCLSVWWTRDVRHTPRVFNGPMVQMVTTDGFTLTWQIDPDIEAQVAIFDDQDTELGDITLSRIKDPVTSAQTRWSATVRGLQPGLSYRYWITAALPSKPETIVSEHSVRTAGRPGQPFRFIALGDTGTGKSAQYRVARQLSAWRPDLVLHAGDIITPKPFRHVIPAKFFRPYADLLPSAPMYACLGNHDCRVEQGQTMLDTFVLPDNGPAGEQAGRHYWFDWGDVRFIFVDSNHDYPYFRDTVAPWLDGVLADAGGRWTVTVWHEPVVTNGSQYPPAEKLRLSLVPVMDKHRCTLAFSGHQHLYERSWPIRNGQVVPPTEGTVYITSGAGGSNLYEELMPQSPLIAAWCDSQHSFTVVDVTADRLVIRQIGDTGNLIDTHIVERSRN